MDASDLDTPTNRSIEDYRGTLVATAGELQRAREMAALMQKPHVKYRDERGAQTALIGDGFEVGYTDEATLRLRGGRLFGTRQFEVLSFWARVEVDGRSVRGRVRLEDGARIKAGGTTFQYGSGAI